MNIHDRARQLSAQKGITTSEAYSQLSKRRKTYGTLKLTDIDRDLMRRIETPALKLNFVVTP